MTLPINLSVTQIEQKIVKVTAELENARALEYAKAEKAFLAAQKLFTLAREKVASLLTKPIATLAAKNRLAAAKAELTAMKSAAALAETHLNSIEKEQERAKKISRKVERLLISKKLSKKIEFSRKEKSALKIMRKNAKEKRKLAKEETVVHLLEQPTSKPIKAEDKKLQPKKFPYPRKPKALKIKPVANTEVIVQTPLAEVKS